MASIRARLDKVKADPMLLIDPDAAERTCRDAGHRYEYNGLATLVGTEYLEADLLYTRYNTSGAFDRIDNLNRVEDDIWTRGIDNDANPGYDVYRDFYDMDISWSRSSNIDLVEDNVYPGWDVAYTNDGLERLAQAERGAWSGSAITSPRHDEQWTLSQTGNWEHYLLDLDGDGAYTDPDELDDDQTFNVVNELTARDTDDDGADDHDLVYDAAGNRVRLRRLGQAPQGEQSEPGPRRRVHLQRPGLQDRLALRRRW